MTKARCHALARRTRRSSNHPDRSAPILTGEAAMVAAGASTPNLPASPTEFQGLQLPSVPLLVADLARTSHPLSAYANISTTFSRVTEFDNRDQGTSRARESALKSEILEALSPFGSTRSIAQIRTLTKRADAGAGSVWEAGFLWMLHCWLKPSIELESQYHLTLDGLNYYCDAAIPTMKISLEFDGAGKLGITRTRPGGPLWKPLNAWTQGTSQE